MTNAEKYKEVFGMPVDPSMCPTRDCIYCPCHTTYKNSDSMSDSMCEYGSSYEWWNEEYKGVFI